LPDGWLVARHKLELGLGRLLRCLWKSGDPEVWLGLQVATECLRNVPWVDCLLRLLELLLLLLLLLEGALLLEASLLLSEVLLEVERLLLRRLLLRLERLLRPLLEALLLLSRRLRWTECAQRIPELRRVEECVYPVDERLEEGAVSAGALSNPPLCGGLLGEHTGEEEDGHHPRHPHHPRPLLAHHPHHHLNLSASRSFSVLSPRLT
jgi:hypothetical protein